MRSDGTAKLLSPGPLISLLDQVETWFYFS
jgi:hypothetical protein